MNNDLESRVAELEKESLRHHAFSIFQTHAVAVLLALIEHCAENPGQLPPGECRRFYARTLREETEKFLASIADDDPALATRLREILKSGLDATESE